MSDAATTEQYVPIDWTVDPETGRADSSALFQDMGRFVGSVIRNQATMVVTGQMDALGTLIMAQLAHKKGFVPVGHNQGVQIESARLQNGKLVGTLWFGGERLTFTTEDVFNPTP